jgi:hypothetical protein
MTLRVALLLGALALVFIPAAAADVPTIERFSIDFAIADAEICDFPVALSGRGDFLSKTFADGRFQAHIYEHDVLTANGKTIVGDETFNVFEREIGDVIVGLFTRSYLPSGGVVVIEAGRLVRRDGEIVFEAGPHPLVHGDTTALCAALANA